MQAIFGVLLLRGLESNENPFTVRCLLASFASNLGGQRLGWCTVAPSGAPRAAARLTEQGAPVAVLLRPFDESPDGFASRNKARFFSYR